jgi:uncharacterized membrane protein YcaP (DUF421 family)
MDPLRIVIRVVFAYVVMLVFVRLSGKRTVSAGTPFDFALAVIIGDMFDDALWAEVAASEFIVAAGTLFVIQTTLDYLRYRAGVAAFNA